MYTLPNLSPSVARETFANLCATLPPPVADTADACEIFAGALMGLCRAMGRRRMCGVMR